MNTGQMLLSAGAVMLLGSTVLTVNKTFTQHGTILTQTQIGLYAVSLASSVVQDAAGQRFDEATVSNSVTSTSELTSVGTLGPEGGEVYPRFDDFDDYNGLAVDTLIWGVDEFRIVGKVFYVSDTIPNIALSSPSFHKQLNVAVTSYAMADTIRLSYIFSYFNFR